jgi:hypothetical protein
MRARVLGMGLWMPGFPTSASWLSNRPSTGADAPNAQSKQRRRSSLLVNMVADVAAQASAQSGVPLSRARVVVGSAFGELTTLVEMLEERERDGLLSPLRFQNSVHNSAAGQLSIAAKNKAPAMSLAAGNDTVAMALLEAMTLLALGGDEVLAVRRGRIAAALDPARAGGRARCRRRCSWRQTDPAPKRTGAGRARGSAADTRDAPNGRRRSTAPARRSCR